MEPSPELRDVIRGWFDSVARGDASWADRHVSHQAGCRLVGTDPTELLHGEQVAAFLKGEVEAVGGQAKITTPEVEAYREGSVGWGLAQPTISLPNGKAVSPRWSAVFHQEDGEWKVVQVHASLGISNEQAFGTDLPLPR